MASLGERASDGRSRRTAGGAPTAAPNATRSAILAVAMELLDERGPDGFTIDDVLVRSDTSASSLYHHFGNRDGLVLAAEGERYRQTMMREDRGNLDGGFAARTTEELFDFVAAQLRRIATDPDNRQVRRDRFAVVGRALTSPRLAAGARSYQERMLDVIVEVFDDAQARGLIDQDLDTRAYCAWFHGMTLGRTATEGGTVDGEAWLRVAIPAALAPLLPKPPAAGPQDAPDEPAPG